MRISRITAALLLASVVTTAQATGPTWAWTAGKVQSNGAITLQSSNGSSTYNAVQNPTGATANVNQNAATQPPLIIMQGRGQLNRGSMYYADRSAGLP